LLKICYMGFWSVEAVLQCEGCYNILLKGPSLAGRLQEAREGMKGGGEWKEVVELDVSSPLNLGL
jgi:hypothetical protein